MPPSKDQGGVPPSFDRHAEVTIPDTTETIAEDTPGPVSFLDNLDVSMFDVSSIDFSEVLDAPWLSEHASIDDIVPVADNFSWPGRIPLSETHQPNLHVEDGPSQEELSALLLAFPSPAERDVATLEAPESEPMNLDPTSNVPLLPVESTVGEAQPMINQQDVFGGFEKIFHQHLGLQFSAGEIADGGAGFLESQHHGVPSGPSSFRESGDGMHNAHAMNTTVHGVSSMQALDVLDTGHSATNPYWPPMFPQQRSLVPRKRGGKHGRLTEDQLKRQRTARLTGVCIRCKYLNKSCHGGFPCERCQTLRKPTIFTGPCTKAQFLEIIEAGSFFLRTSLYGGMLLKCLDDQTALELVKLSSIGQSLGRPLVIKVLGKRCELSYLLGLDLLQVLHLAGPASRFRKLGNPNAAQLVSCSVGQTPQRDRIKFPYEFKGSERVYWTLLASSLCSGKYLFLPKSDEASGEEKPALPCLDGSTRISNEALRNTLVWLSCRYGELCLFHHLQEASNHLAKNAAPDLNLVYCIFIILRMSMANDKLESSLKTCDDHQKMTMMKEYVDRRKRVRMALWVYASIGISNIQSWTDFWESLPWCVDIFREPKVLKRFADSLDSFDAAGFKASKSVFNSRKSVFQRLSFSDDLLPHENYTEDQDFVENLWTRILTNTPEGVEQLKHVLSDASSGSADGVTQYELDEAERFFLPKAEEDQKVTVRRVFGRLISVRSAPMDRDGIFPQSAIQWPIRVIKGFQHRLSLKEHEHSASTSRSPSGSATAQPHEHTFIPSHDELREYMDTPKCIKASKRWKELTRILGDGILLAGNRDEDNHCFLDISTVVESGSDAEFSRLKRLLQLKGSWLKAICAKLSGLVQALRELPYPEKDLERTRDFYVQVYNTTSEISAENFLPDPHNSFHKFWMTLNLALISHSFMPARSEVSERHRVTWDILTNCIDQTRTEILEDKLILDRNPMDWFDEMTKAIHGVTERFIARYVDTLSKNNIAREDAAVNMAETYSLAMVSALGILLRGEESLPECPGSTRSFDLVFED